MRGALVLAIALTACGGEHTHDHDGDHDHGHAHGHDHGGASIGITKYTETHELFAEHPPAVVGRELPFLAHITVLDGFRALEDARVRLVLEGPARLTAETGMLRPGIYRLALTPRMPGVYRGRLEITRGGEGTVDGIEIHVFATEAEAQRSVEAEEAPHTISFLKEQQWRVPFATAFAARGSVAPTVLAPAEITTPPEGRANVHAPVAGRIAPASDDFPMPGEVVEQGQVLATMAPTPGAPEDAARAELAVVEAQNELEAARQALERYVRLLADRAVPERQVNEARRRVEVAEASVAASQRVQGTFASASRGAQGRGSWRIVAPIAGVIDEVSVSPGQAVEANALLVRIVDPAHRWLSARVPESWAPRMRPEGGATFHLLGDENWRPVVGALVNVGRSVDPVTRSVQVIWTLTDPAPELRVGASAEVAIPVGEATEGIVVPRSAIIEAEGRDLVIVQREGESFEERPVRAGASDGGRVAIVEGLEAGERIVTQGGYLVRLAARAAEGGASHGHIH